MYLHIRYYISTYLYILSTYDMYIYIGTSYWTAIMNHVQIFNKVANELFALPKRWFADPVRSGKRRIGRPWRN